MRLLQLELQELRWGAERQESALGQQGDTRGQGERFLDIVRDQERRLAQAFVKSVELRAQLPSRDRIECSKRLVQQENRGIGRERARHADTLALSATQLMRVSAGEGRRIKPHQVEQLAHARGRALRAPPFERRHERDVLRDGEVGEETDFLDDVADAAAEANRIPGCCRTPFDEDFAFGRREQSVDELERRGLPRPAATEKDEQLAAPYLERERRDPRRLPLRAITHVPELDDDVVA
ncbi:hypothetical protein HRbin08_01907 [bacterium HR08]|nr:hypothetical protein HRbin08_01907 [bacterium HR08]